MFDAVRMALAAWAVAALAGPTEPIAYQATPVVEGGVLDGVDITLSFRGDADGRTEVRLPQSWAGAGRLERTVGDIRVEGARLRRNGARLRLRHRGGEPIRLTYRVRQDYQGPPRVGFDRPYRPSTLDDGFTLVGWTVFARVQGREDQSARFDWGPVPARWGVASDLDHLQGAPVAYDELADSVLMGGRDLRVLTREAAGGPVRVAVHGAWRFAPEALADRYARIVEASSAFWGDAGRPAFLAVTPLDGAPGAEAQAGLGLGDGVAVWLSADMALDQADHVLIHEQLHAWLPDRVGGLAEGPAEVLDFWFSEGFTDFYAQRTALRAELSTPEAYLAALDRALELQARTPPGMGNAAVARAFFSDPQAAGVPYHRGLLLAAVLDAEMAAIWDGERNLDDVVRAMRRGQGRAPARLIQAYGDLGGGDLRPALFHHVDRGAPILLDPNAFGDCAVVFDADGRQRIEPGPGLFGATRDVCIARLAGL